MDLISSIETFEARVPLAAPLAVGSARITHRTYSVVKITTSDGIVGVGYCYSRGLPMAKIIDDVMTPVAIGQSAESPEEIRKLILGFNWQSAEHGSVTSAASAVDIALHDIAGKRAGRSVASMLGAMVSEVPIYSVIGYHYGKDETGLAEEIEYALSRGINSFKIVMGADTPQRDANRLRVLRERVGDKPLIALDAFRTLKTLDNAITRVNLIKEFGIAFVEDPFLESEGVAAIALREATGVPVSFGESLASSKMAEQVLYYNQTDILRIDALVIGGVGEFLKAITYAHQKGKTFATHIHTEIHSQLAAATSNLYPGGLEYLDPRYEIDLFHHLLQKPIEIRDGKAILSTEPGFGIQWDWQAIQHFSA
ncbi:MAG: mandelate racemase/muconate lactonizing enzyme family protein [Actinomycetes bacterium]